MMKKLLGLVCLPLLGLQAQHLQVTNAPVNFGSTDELNSITAEVNLYNPKNQDIEVTDIDFFKMFGDEPFSASDTAFVIAALDSHSVTVSFLPEHNINHEMGMIIKTVSGFGNVPVELVAQGTYSKNYYSSTENKSETALVNAISNKISSGYNSLGYTNARDNMYGSIDNNNGSVECAYTGRTASFSTRSGANANSFNCEHTYPQGKFNQNEPMRSDIHHLFPTDVSANSQRGNDPFGVVNNASWSQGGSKSGGGKFEPRDVQKGASARAMMYFVLRYQDYGNFFQGQENTLYQWHFQYPPSQAEKQRNSDIHNLQNNRNPFVDYPQFKERIGSLVGSASLASFKLLYRSDDTIKVLENQQGGRLNYDFVLYNEGNTSISLSNFQLSDTSLSFVQSLPASINLGAHESQLVTISYNSAKKYQNASLQFSTDIPNQSSVTVPIRSGVEIGTEEFSISKLEVYPNPVKDELTIRAKDLQINQVWLSDISGRTEALSVSEAGKLDLSGQAPGIYILRVILENGQSAHQKIVVQ